MLRNRFFRIHGRRPDILLRALYRSLEGGRSIRIAASPAVKVPQKNLGLEIHVALLARAVACPLEDRPYRVHRANKDVLELRNRAPQLTEILGVDTGWSLGPRAVWWF